VASLGLPRRLSEVGVGKDRFREIAEKSMHDRAVLNNPRPIKSPAEVLEILELAA
jgi:maleylacetate reductase